MGECISCYDLQKIHNQMSSRLLIYQKNISAPVDNAISVSRDLSRLILSFRPNMRSIRMADCLDRILSPMPDNVVIKDIDVLFNPNYEVDVLRLLAEEKKRKSYSVIWPGSFRDGQLVYGEEGYLDYVTYNIANYDVTCVIY